jgi:hypothetical protein
VADAVDERVDQAQTRRKGDPIPAEPLDGPLISLRDSADAAGNHHDDNKENDKQKDEKSIQSFHIMHILSQVLAAQCCRIEPAEANASYAFARREIALTPVNSVFARGASRRVATAVGGRRYNLRWYFLPPP